MPSYIPDPFEYIKAQREKNPDGFGTNLASQGLNVNFARKPWSPKAAVKPEPIDFVALTEGDPEFDVADYLSDAQVPSAYAETLRNDAITQAQDALEKYGEQMDPQTRAQFQKIAQLGDTQDGSNWFTNILNVLDAPGELVRMGIADLFVDSKAGVEISGADYWDALIGNEDKVRERLGEDFVGDGQFLMEGSRMAKALGWGTDESNLARGAVGLLFDIVLDPLTYVSFGTVGLGKKVAMEGAQLGLQRSAKEAIEAVAKNSIGDLSDSASREAAQRIQARVAKQVDEIGGSPIERMANTDRVTYRVLAEERRALDAAQGLSVPRRQILDEGVLDEDLAVPFGTVLEQMTSEVLPHLADKQFRTLAQQAPWYTMSRNVPNFAKGGVQIGAPFGRKKFPMLRIGGTETNRLASALVGRKAVASAFEKMPGGFQSWMKDLGQRTGVEKAAFAQAREGSLWRVEAEKNMRDILIKRVLPEEALRPLAHGIEEARRVAQKVGMEQGEADKAIRELLGGRTEVLGRVPAEFRAALEEAIEGDAERGLDGIRQVFSTFYDAARRVGMDMGQVPNYSPLVVDRTFSKFLDRMAGEGIDVAVGEGSTDMANLGLAIIGRYLNNTGEAALGVGARDLTYSQFAQANNVTEVFRSFLGGVRAAEELSQNPSLRSMLADGDTYRLSADMANDAVKAALDDIVARNPGVRKQAQAVKQAFSTDMIETFNTYVASMGEAIQHRDLIRRLRRVGLIEGKNTVIDVSNSLRSVKGRLSDDMASWIDDIAEGKGTQAASRMVAVKTGGRSFKTPASVAANPEFKKLANRAARAFSRFDSKTSEIRNAVEVAERRLIEDGYAPELAARLAFASGDQEMSQILSEIADVALREADTLQGAALEMAARGLADSNDVVASAIDEARRIMVGAQETINQMEDQARRALNLPAVQLDEVAVDLLDPDTAPKGFNTTLEAMARWALDSAEARVGKVGAQTAESANLPGLRGATRQAMAKEAVADLADRAIVSNLTVGELADFASPRIAGRILAEINGRLIETGYRGADSLTDEILEAAEEVFAAEFRLFTATSGREAAEEALRAAEKVLDDASQGLRGSDELMGDMLDHVVETVADVNDSILVSPIWRDVWAASIHKLGGMPRGEFAKNTKQAVAKGLYSSPLTPMAPGSRTAPRKFLEGLADPDNLAEASADAAGARGGKFGDPVEAWHEPPTLSERPRRLKPELTTDEFLEDVRRNGIRTPIRVGYDSNGVFEIVDGHHRLWAAQQLGIDEVPVVFSYWDDLTSRASKNLSPFLRADKDLFSPAMVEDLDAAQIFTSLPWKPKAPTQKELTGKGAKGVAREAADMARSLWAMASTSEARHLEARAADFLNEGPSPIRRVIRAMMEGDHQVIAGHPDEFRTVVGSITDKAGRSLFDPARFSFRPNGQIVYEPATRTWATLDDVADSIRQIADNPDISDIEALSIVKQTWDDNPAVVEEVNDLLGDFFRQVDSAGGLPYDMENFEYLKRFVADLDGTIDDLSSGKVVETLTQAEDQLARKARSNWNYTAEALRPAVRTLLEGGEIAEEGLRSRAQALMKWWRINAEAPGGLVRALNADEIEQWSKLGKGEEFFLDMASTDIGGLFASGARKGKAGQWTMEFGDSTKAALNDLNQIEAARGGDEWLVSGHFKVDSLDAERQVIKVSPTRQAAPEPKSAVKAPAARKGELAPVKKLLNEVDKAFRTGNGRKLTKLWESTAEEVRRVLPAEEMSKLTDLVGKAESVSSIAGSKYGDQLRILTGSAEDAADGFAHDVAMLRRQAWDLGEEWAEATANDAIAFREAFQRLLTFGDDFDETLRPGFQPLTEVGGEFDEAFGATAEAARTLRKSVGKAGKDKRLAAFLPELPDNAQGLNAWLKELEKGMSNWRPIKANTASKGFVSPKVAAVAGESLEGLQMTPGVALMFDHMAAASIAVASPLGVRLAAESYREIEKWWKAAATVARPTFVPRNAFSGAVNGLLIGVGPRHYAAVNNNVWKFRQLLDEFGVEGAIKQLPENFQPYMDGLWKSGLLSTSFSHTLDRLKIKPELGELVNPFSSKNAVFRAGGAVMESSEDFLRAAAFIRWYDPANPATMKLAKEMALAAHFDYTSLTRMETSIKRFVPFFVWTRRNLPLQMRAMIEQPGTINRFNHLKENVNHEFEGGFVDEIGFAQSPYLSSFAMKTPFIFGEDTPYWQRLLLDPQLPVRDIEEVLKAFEEGPAGMGEWLIRSLSPAFSSPIQIFEEYDTVAPTGLREILMAADAVLPGEGVAGFEEGLSGDMRGPAFAANLFSTALPFLGEWTRIAGIVPTSPSQAARGGFNTEDGVEGGERIKAAALGLGRAIGTTLQTPADTRSASYDAIFGMYDEIDDMKLKGQIVDTEDLGEVLETLLKRQGIDPDVLRLVSSE